MNTLSYFIIVYFTLVKDINFYTTYIEKFKTSLIQTTDDFEIIGF